MRRHALAAAVAVGLLVGGAAGCANPSDPAAHVLRVVEQPRIGLTEWSIETGDVAAVAGEVTLTVTNAGATGHDLVVHGRHGTWRTPVLAPGERAELAIRTVSGERLHLECTVTGHHAQGMHAELPVDGLGR